MKGPTFLVMAGCGEDTDTVEGLSPREAQIAANCRAVQQAAARFAVRNNGDYPANVSVHQNHDGHTLLDLLPDEGHLTNPFTGAVTEPVDGSASTPGETGYQAVADGSGSAIDYLISGFGESEIILNLSENDPLD